MPIQRALVAHFHSESSGAALDQVKRAIRALLSFVIDTFLPSRLSPNLRGLPHPTTTSFQSLDSQWQLLRLISHTYHFKIALTSPHNAQSRTLSMATFHRLVVTHSSLRSSLPAFCPKSISEFVTRLGPISWQCRLPASIKL